MRIVFMGTPDIAATCLKKIIDDGFQVVGVYTQPDRPKNRGMKLAFSPVKEVAIAHDLPVFQPENFREDETVEQLRALIRMWLRWWPTDGSCPSVCWIFLQRAVSISMPAFCLRIVVLRRINGQFWTAVRRDENEDENKESICGASFNSCVYVDLFWLHACKQSL